MILQIKSVSTASSFLSPLPLSFPLPPLRVAVAPPLLLPPSSSLRTRSVTAATYGTSYLLFVF